MKIPLIRILKSSLLILLGIANYSLALDVGDEAPDFQLQATDGKSYKLSDVLEQEAVVLAWFPFAGTRGCTIECKSLAQNGHLLKNLSVTYFMASVDPIEDNQEFAEENNADFPLLSDPTKQTAKDYDVLSLGLYAKRHTFYIGRDGVILYVDRDVRPETSAEDMAQKLIDLGIPQRKAS